MVIETTIFALLTNIVKGILTFGLIGGIIFSTIWATLYFVHKRMPAQSAEGSKWLYKFRKKFWKSTAYYAVVYSVILIAAVWVHSWFICI